MHTKYSAQKEKLYRGHSTDKMDICRANRITALQIGMIFLMENTFYALQIKVYLQSK